MVEDNESIFVSYRRDETAAYAGWLADRLGYHFGKQKVFRDIGSIEPGTDFVEAIERALESCAATLVVIGRNWGTTLKEHEQTGQEDYTRLEVATALRRNVRVIPVLVQGASMPRAEELPDDLAALRRRQAIELHDTNWESDVEYLIAVLEKVMGPQARSTVVPDLSGQEISQARSTLTNKALKLGAQNDASSDTVPEGQIIEQSPEAGTVAKAGSLVSVTVSSGPSIVEVPDLVGKSRDEARITLNNVGLELGAQAKVRSDDIPEGQIIEQSPEAGRQVQAGSLVNFTVSSRLPPQPVLPALAGSWWALFLRGLVLAIFGLALLVMPTILNATGGGYFRLVSAIVMILDWIFATIDAQTTRADRRRWLLIQGRISFLLGLFTFVTWFTLVTGLIDLELARYLVGSWAVVIGIFRIAAAIQLGWETKNSLLMGASGVLLIFFGMGALLLPASTFWWRPLGPLPLASGITLIAFALLWVWNRERSGAGE